MLLEKVLDFFYPQMCCNCGKITKNERKQEKSNLFFTIQEKEKDYKNKITRKLYKIYKNIQNEFLNENWVCDDCKEKIIKCEKTQIIKVYNKSYDYLIYMFEYKSLIRRLIIKYKFKGETYISNLFTYFMLKEKKICRIFSFYDIIIPIPMSKDKKRLRGYNQTELLAKNIKKQLFLKSIGDTNNSEFWLNSLIEVNSKVLLKNKNVKKQSSLSKEERIKNVKNAFYINEKYKKKIENKKVILLDDIFTTGATVEECSKILKEAGVAKILVIVIAKD
jgi:ComF family protein